MKGRQKTHIVTRFAWLPIRTTSTGWTWFRWVYVLQEWREFTTYSGEMETGVEAHTFYRWTDVKIWKAKVR